MTVPCARWNRIQSPVYILPDENDVFYINTKSHWATHKVPCISGLGINLLHHH